MSVSIYKAPLTCSINEEWCVKPSTSGIQSVPPPFSDFTCMLLPSVPVLVFNTTYCPSSVVPQKW